MADDHSNPPRLPGPRATVHDMATVAGIRHSARPAQQAQYRTTVRAVGGDILTGLPAFYWADGSLTQLPRDHKYWSELEAYIEGNTMGPKVEVEVRRDFVYSRWAGGDQSHPVPAYHQRQAQTALSSAMSAIMAVFAGITGGSMFWYIGVVSLQGIGHLLTVPISIVKLLPISMD